MYIYMTVMCITSGRNTSYHYGEDDDYDISTTAIGLGTRTVGSTEREFGMFCNGQASNRYTEFNLEH